MDRAQLRRDLVADEGLRLRVYPDTKGFPTMYIGKNLLTNPLDPEEIQHGGAIGYFTEEFAYWLLDRDVSRCIAHLDKFHPWWKGEPDPTQRALVNMRFQLGGREFQRFKPTLDLIASGHIEAAISRIKKTPWYHETTARVERHFQRLRDR